HLPGGPRAVARWSSIFIPTLISAIGDQDEVWGHIGLEALFHATLQDTWDVVYEDIPHIVTNDGPVMAIALQRLSEWRNGIGSTAVTVFTNFMSLQDDVKTDEDRKGFAESLLVNLAFLYGNIMEDGKCERPFQSDLIIQVLVQHTCATWGAIDSHRKRTYAKGALSLCTAAACISPLSSQHG
ncbi:hypothetical protein EV424DRAFT_1322951, partial [Suillus variegatus]